MAAFNQRNSCTLLTGYWYLLNGSMSFRDNQFGAPEYLLRLYVIAEGGKYQ